MHGSSARDTSELRRTRWHLYSLACVIVLPLPGHHRPADRARATVPGCPHRGQVMDVTGFFKKPCAKPANASQPPPTPVLAAGGPPERRMKSSRNSVAPRRLVPEGAGTQSVEAVEAQSFASARPMQAGNASEPAPKKPRHLEACCDDSPALAAKQPQSQDRPRQAPTDTVTCDEDITIQEVHDLDPDAARPIAKKNQVNSAPAPTDSDTEPAPMAITAPAQSGSPSDHVSERDNAATTVVKPRSAVSTQHPGSSKKRKEAAPRDREQQQKVQARGQRTVAASLAGTRETVPSVSKAAAKGGLAGTKKKTDRRRDAPKVANTTDRITLGDQYFEVEQLTHMQVVNKSTGRLVKDWDKKLSLENGMVREFRVKWRDFDDSESTWEREERITPHAVEAFLKGAPVTPEERAQQGWSAVLPAKLHPSVRGYREARELIVINKMVVAIHNGKKHPWGPRKQKPVAGAATTAANAMATAAVQAGAKAAAANASETLMPARTPAPVKNTVKDDIVLRESDIADVDLVLKELNALIPLAKALRAVETSGALNGDNAKQLATYSSQKGLLEARHTALMGNCLVGVRKKFSIEQLHNQPIHEFSESEIQHAVVPLPPAHVVPANKKQGEITASGWKCRFCKKTLRYCVKEKIWSHFCTDDHLKAVLMVDGTDKDRGNKFQSDKMEKMAGIVDKFRVMVSVSAAQHSLPMTAVRVNSDCAQKLVNSITNGHTFTASEIAAAMKYIPRAADVLLNLNAVTALRKKENGSDPLKALQTTNGAAKLNVETSASNFRVEAAVKFASKSVPMVCMVIDESTRDAAKTKVAYVTLVACTTKFKYLKFPVGQINVGVEGMTTEKYCAEVKNLLESSPEIKEAVDKLELPGLWERLYFLAVDGCHSMRSTIENAGYDGNVDINGLPVGESFLAELKRTASEGVNPAGSHSPAHIFNLAMEDVITDTFLDLENYYIQHLQALTGRLRKSAPKTDVFIKCDAEVRKTPSWPRSWANFSLLCLYSHRNAWAGLHFSGQPNTFLALGKGLLEKPGHNVRRSAHPTAWVAVFGPSSISSGALDRFEYSYQFCDYVVAWLESCAGKAHSEGIRGPRESAPSRSEDCGADSCHT